MGLLLIDTLVITGIPPIQTQMGENLASVYEIYLLVRNLLILNPLR